MTPLYPPFVGQIVNLRRIVNPPSSPVNFTLTPR